MGQIDRHRQVKRQRPGGEGLGLHRGQHAAHIGVAQDRLGARLGAAALLAFHRIGQRVLIGSLGNPYALHTHTETRVVHHREHRRHALMRLSDQPAGGTIILHYSRGGAVQAKLMLKAHHFETVPHACPAIFGGQVPRH